MRTVTSGGGAGGGAEEEEQPSVPPGVKSGHAPLDQRAADALPADLGFGRIHGGLQGDFSLVHTTTLVDSGYFKMFQNVAGCLRVGD